MPMQLPIVTARGGRLTGAGGASDVVQGLLGTMGAETASLA